MSRDYPAVAADLSPTGDRAARMRAVVDALWAGFASQGVSWVGFYLDVPGAPDDRRLVLGPHRDTPACSPIGLHGVCGTALTTLRTQIVRDVASLGDRYVACDPRDRSEIVLVLGEDDVAPWGVLDLDSRAVGAFSPDDEQGLRLVLAAAGLAARTAPPAARTPSPGPAPR